MTEYFHWHGRDDGPGDEHARWFTTIIDAEAEPVPPNTITLVGFASDTGVARNHGRVGAATGPRSEERRVGKEWRSRWSPYH